jgi:hypothetical protein
MEGSNVVTQQRFKAKYVTALPRAQHVTTIVGRPLCVKMSVCTLLEINKSHFVTGTTENR